MAALLIRCSFGGHSLHVLKLTLPHLYQVLGRAIKDLPRSEIVVSSKVRAFKLHCVQPVKIAQHSWLFTPLTSV